MEKISTTEGEKKTAEEGGDPCIHFEILRFFIFAVRQWDYVNTAAVPCMLTTGQVLS